MEEHKITKIEELRRIVKVADTNVNLGFRVEPHTSLADAYRLWELVCTEGGGFGVLINPDLLGHKEDALQFINMKIDQLRRWKNVHDRKVIALDDILQELETVLQNGGPGVPPGYEPRIFKGNYPYVDVDQEISARYMATHVMQIRAMLLQDSPGTRVPAQALVPWRTAFLQRNKRSGT